MNKVKLGVRKRTKQSDVIIERERVCYWWSVDGYRCPCTCTLIFVKESTTVPRCLPCEDLVLSLSLMHPQITYSQLAFLIPYYFHTQTHNKKQPLMVETHESRDKTSLGFTLVFSHIETCHVRICISQFSGIMEH